MEAIKVDRRVKFTKILLKNSLVELMRRHPLSKISVKLLCETADINRSTFYAHYTDQYDLLRQLEQEVIVELEKHISKDDFSKHTSQTVEALNQIMIYIAKNADLFKILLSENGDSTFQRKIMLLAQQKTITDLRNDQFMDPRTSEYLQCFVTTGALSILQKWLEDDMVESPESMSDLASKLLYKGLSAFYS
jgi:AcrR family transcriptional regulator